MRKCRKCGTEFDPEVSITCPSCGAFDFEEVDKSGAQEGQPEEESLEQTGG